jgi:biotin carboxylase
MAYEDTGTLLIVGGRPDTVRKAVGLGLDVVLIQHRDHFAPEMAALARAVIIADYTDWETIEPLVVAAHKSYEFTRAITLTEPGLEPTGRINDLFGLGLNSYDVARLLKNKLEMRERLARTSPETSVAATEAVDEESLRAFGAAHGYPFIVKPADVTASVGVHKVDAPEQVPAVWAEVERLRARTDLLWGAFFTIGPHIVEEYLEGPEFSVEAYSFDGRHVVVAITEKLTTGSGFLELGHAQPARVSDTDALVECTTTFLDAVGLRHGPSHTEIKLTPAGPKIIEGHNRIGGDRIVDLLELSYGVDFETLVVGVPFGLVDPLAGSPPLRTASATRFLTAPPGVVVAVEGADEVRAQPDVFALDVTVAPGSVVRAGSNWERCGQVIVVGPDTDSAVARCAELTDQITIRVEEAR